MPSRLFRASFGKIELTGRLEVFAFQSSDIVRSPGNIAPRQFGGNRGKGIVVPDMADRTTSFGSSLLMSLATCLIIAGEPTEVPPNFMTLIDLGS